VALFASRRNPIPAGNRGDRQIVRNAFCRSLCRCATDDSFVFLTGDLGFMALEALQEAAGARFINAGVAEQNMVSAAAGLAHSGLSPWVYSIAPFVYARPYEQVRNDICLHDLPVTLVGNGGGYGYGVMGGTHHALEDYGALLCLQNMHVFVPAFTSDVEHLVPKLAAFSHPAYLRLGRDEKPEEYSVPEYAAWRRLTCGDGPTLVVVGPLAGTYLSPLAALPASARPNLWVVTELPFTEDTLPYQFLEDLRASRRLIVVEEHVRHGSAGEALAAILLRTRRAPAGFEHYHALGYVSGRYGSQQFHRRECGLDAESLLARLACK